MTPFSLVVGTYLSVKRTASISYSEDGVYSNITLTFTPYRKKKTFLCRETNHDSLTVHGTAYSLRQLRYFAPIRCEAEIEFYLVKS
jgi:hypothetical protein